MTILVLGAAAWCVAAGVLAVGIGRAARLADQRSSCCPHPDVEAPAEEDLLADLPAAVLSPAEVDERFRQIVAPLPTWEHWL